MPQILEGNLVVGDAKIAVLVSRFNDFITSRLVDGAIDAYVRHGGDEANLTIAYVPGSFELPVAAKRMVESGRYEAVLCLGAVIRGATGHYDHVAGNAAAGVAKVGVESGMPVIFGVITADSLEQAIERAGSKQGNQGAKAMLAAIEMVNLFRQV